MNSKNIWSKTPDRLPLLTAAGREFKGLEQSSSPELVQGMQSLFNYLDKIIGFCNTAYGLKNQEGFNTLLRAAYPELMLDLADLLYVQHERPAVFLNFDHININLRRDKHKSYEPLDTLNQTMGSIFNNFCDTLRSDAALNNDPEIIRILSESYSHYMHQTKNFPWDDPLPNIPPGFTDPVLDIATGLTGFGWVHLWPDDHPQLLLTDNMPFITQSLAHFIELAGKKNIKILQIDFSEPPPENLRPGFIRCNKFLHHLKRPDRQRFLSWACNTLKPGGIFSVLDTNLELEILKKAHLPGFEGKLIPGYLETLVEVENDFCENLARDTRDAGFKVTHFDFHEYRDETDAYSEHPGENLSLKFVGLEIEAQKPDV